MFINKRMFILINVLLFILEIVLIYFMINNFLTKDLISPSENTFKTFIEHQLYR